MAALAALHTELDGGRRPGGRLQRPPRRPGAGARCASASPTPGSWPTDRDDQAGWRFWQRDEGRTHPAHSPHRRIDQVWVSAGVAVAAARVLDAEGASDHLPLMVDLLVPSGVWRARTRSVCTRTRSDAQKGSGSSSE